MATISSNAQDIAAINTWINSVITASKLPSELTEQTDITDSSEVSILQKGTDDAVKVATSVLRGYKGEWNASLNTPTIIDGTGINLDTYVVSVAGSQDLGSGIISFVVDDVVIYINDVWTLANEVTSESITNIFSSLSAPQLFNPDATAVTNNTGGFVLSSSNDIAFVTLNGQTLDDSEYGLTGSTITITPDNGFSDITDEILVFQHTFTIVSIGGVIGNYREIGINETMLTSDYIVECTATLTFDLITAVENTGKIIIIKNSSGSGVVTLDGFGTETIEGELTQSILAGDSYTLVSNGTNWVLI